MYNFFIFILHLPVKHFQTKEFVGFSSFFPFLVFPSRPPGVWSFCDFWRARFLRPTNPVRHFSMVICQSAIITGLTFHASADARHFWYFAHYSSSFSPLFFVASDRNSLYHGAIICRFHPLRIECRLMLIDADWCYCCWADWSWLLVSDRVTPESDL